MSSHNLELDEETKNYVLRYQLAKKIESKHSQFAIQKCIIEIINEHKELVQENARLRKALEAHQKTDGD